MFENSETGRLVASYGYLAVLFGTMLEGETVVLVAGFLAHQGHLSIPWIIMCAIIGSSISDQGIFFLTRLRGVGFLRRFPKMEAKVRSMSDRMRARPVGLTLFALFFRFFYGLRNIAPIFLGLSAIPTLRFVCLNAVGAVLWAVIFSLGGWWFARILSLISANLPKYELLLAALLLVAGAGFHFYHRLNGAKADGPKEEKTPEIPMLDTNAPAARQQHKEYWDAAAETKEFSTPLRLEDFAALVPQQARVLDLGCGYGRALAALRVKGYDNLLGLDFSAGMIERGRALHPGLDLRVLEGRELPLPDNGVDAVLLLAVLTCIPEDAEQERLIAETTRVLKPGGILYVNDFLLNTDERNLTRYAASTFGPYGCFTLPDGARLRHHSREHFDRLLRAFEPIRAEETVFTTMNNNRSKGIVWFGRKR